jgi:hypothetical protein
MKIRENLGFEQNAKKGTTHKEIDGSLSLSKKKRCANDTIGNREGKKGGCKKRNKEWVVCFRV